MRPECRTEARSAAEDADVTVDGAGAGLNRLRLLVALDALLVEGSVGRAARRMGLGTPAMSRLLAQLRAVYGDPILIRTGQGMVPTTFAESIRQRVRAVACEAEALLEGLPPPLHESTARRAPVERSRPIVQSPPLAMRPVLPLEGQPLPEDIARKLTDIENDADPHRRLARAIALVGGGAGRSRPLTREEAEEAFSIVLEGEADPIQIGALLIVLQYRGLTADELAGLVSAGRRHCCALPLESDAADLDWPAYLSPKSRTPPWFLHAARLVAQSGQRVLLHGQDGGSGWLDMAVQAAGIPVCETIPEAREALAERRIAFLPVGSFAPQIRALLALYSMFEIRSPLNMLVHLLNPLGASASLLGVSNPSYPAQHRDAAQILGWRQLAILGTRRDVAQATPFRMTPVYRLVDGVCSDGVIPSRRDPGGQARTALSSLEYWDSMWHGRVRDERAREIIVATTAAALQVLSGSGEDRRAAAVETADALWRNRKT
ncbi:glycosyl transferase family protein [Chelativorans sp. AA-79]|uniref:glycosyl transferase family protein n=1 Tax=Chelativorans sp. AA-79 TaxID=3028735 RepID=UPI0023F6286A|nr:glycosyl transferase family protein [Chelativorans sp. AA-79]WEX11032.1 glycosyl transferase family protein [Chelativorans sp. AA-79]